MYLSSVYKVGVDEFTDGLSTDIYTARVLDVIKEGGIISFKPGSVWTAAQWCYWKFVRISK